jgi:hypothetical protein
MRKRIDVEKAKELWANMYSLQMISDEIGFSRQGIKKALNLAGVDTSKDATWQNLECPQCGEMFKKSRALTRNHPGKMYCNSKCYYDSIHNPNFVQWRHGTRIARDVISEYMDIPDMAVAHHEDGNERNNDVRNLMLFANQSDHGKWHRAANHGVSPIFNGSLIG